MTDNPSTDTLAGESHVASADGGVTVEKPALSLEDLNKHLGANFKDTATALQALKDTKDFVGKRKEDIAREMETSVASKSSDVASKSDVQELKSQLFYSENPQYKGYAGLISKLGTDPSAVVDTADFKTVFEKAQVADEVAGNKSIVSSNSRISQARSTVEHMVNVANARGTTYEDVAIVAAAAINEANNQG